MSIELHLSHLQHLHEGLEHTRSVIERGAAACIVSRFYLDKLERGSTKTPAKTQRQQVQDHAAAA